MERVFKAVDETKMGYISEATETMHTSRLSDRELKIIEIALIRFADRFAMAH